eukprot:NODE_795_length_3846_cov_0.843074.p3 type:complete len:178 gc:universal NODE_795_length_3846_cov_0.843074:957-1490(+)
MMLWLFLFAMPPLKLNPESLAPTVIASAVEVVDSNVSSIASINMKLKIEMKFRRACEHKYVELYVDQNEWFIKTNLWIKSYDSTASKKILLSEISDYIETKYQECYKDIVNMFKTDIIFKIMEKGENCFADTKLITLRSNSVYPKYIQTDVSVKLDERFEKLKVIRSCKLVEERKTK